MAGQPVLIGPPEYSHIVFFRVSSVGKCRIMASATNIAIGSSGGSDGLPLQPICKLCQEHCKFSESRPTPDHNVRIEFKCANARRTMERRLKGREANDPLKAFWRKVCSNTDVQIAWYKKMKRREVGAQLKDSELVLTEQEEKYFVDERRDRDEYISFATVQFDHADKSEQEQLKIWHAMTKVAGGTFEDPNNVTFIA